MSRLWREPPAAAVARHWPGASWSYAARTSAPALPGGPGRLVGAEGGGFAPAGVGEGAEDVGGIVAADAVEVKIRRVELRPLGFLPDVYAVAARAFEANVARRRKSSNHAISWSENTKLQEASTRSGEYVIESFGNWFACEIIRKAEGAAAFPQGDGADRFGRELAETNERCTDDDVASPYFD